MRGAEFKVMDGLLPMENGDDDFVAHGALDDIVRWLAFRNVDEYLYALPVLRERIFERATYGEGA